MPDGLDKTEFAIFIKRAGFTLTPEEIAEYYEAYQHVERMATLIRQPRSYMAEPAHMFSFPKEIVS
jgi:methyl coenzyme M reductase alpha subunit